MMIDFDISKLGGSSILSGAPSGRRLYTKLVAALPPEPGTPEPLLLNFASVEVATASFLRESVLEFRNFVRGRRSNFYPVVANAGSDIIDEILELAHSRSDAIMACKTGDDGLVLRHQYIGKLDPMQKLTFDLVRAEGETTAAKLMDREHGKVKITAWNNRLASLSHLGLICEHAHGRAKSYKPMFFAGVEDGC